MIEIMAIMAMMAKINKLEAENTDMLRQLDEMQTMLTACGFEVIEDYNKLKAIKGHEIIYMQDRTE